jgi:CBS domain-containing protein
MKNLLKVASKPAVAVPKNATVMEAVRTMLGARVGAAAVVDDDGKLCGVFTERDVMARVVLEKRNPETTKVVEVMTANVMTIHPDADPHDALHTMIEKHFRHLPVVDAQGKVIAILSMRHLMREHIDELRNSVGALENYISTDGIGG